MGKVKIGGGKQCQSACVKRSPALVQRRSVPLQGLQLSRPKNSSATKKKIVEVVTVRACNQG